MGVMDIGCRSLVQSAEARKLTAYHESGHALVAMHSEGSDPIHKATIVPRGHALGMVSQVLRISVPSYFFVRLIPSHATVWTADALSATFGQLLHLMHHFGQLYLMGSTA